MRHAYDKALTYGTAAVIVVSVLLPWAWGELKRARREQPRPQYTAAS